ncbi:MAG: hypothetical protein ACKPKO_52655, partial [Candidatus Fonsibacter sp.]
MDYMLQHAKPSLTFFPPSIARMLDVHHGQRANHETIHDVDYKNSIRVQLCNASAWSHSDTMCICKLCLVNGFATSIDTAFACMAQNESLQHKCGHIVPCLVQGPGICTHLHPSFSLLFWFISVACGSV